MLGKFSKGAGGRGVCRATDNSLTILMALSVDDMKVILERAEGGGVHCIGDALTACFWDIHPVALIMLKCCSDVPGLVSMRDPVFMLLWFFIDDHFNARRCQDRAVIIKVPF